MMVKTQTKVIVFSVFYLLFAVSLSGCEAFRRKFVRKSKREMEIKVIVETREYSPQYSVEEMYQRYYSFWLAAHNELAELLDTQETNHKRVMAFARKVEENLTQMRELLTGEKQEVLNACITEQQDIISRLKDSDLNRARRLQIKSALNKQRKKVQGEFAYQYIKEYIRK